MKRMTWWQRWRSRFVGGAVLLAGATGCKQPVFLEPADWQASLRPGIPPGLEERPHDPILPGAGEAGPTPATVRDFNRPQRPLSLKEAFAVAVEQGNVGSLGLNGQDTFGQLPSFTGGSIKQTDSIKAYLYDPAFTAADVERSLSKFDARLISSMTWAKQDQATLSLQQSFSNGDSANLTNTLAKPLPTGGVAGITTSIAYQKLSTPPGNQQFVTLNTSYAPRVQFILEQPLMQGFGIEANQLINQHPGSVLIPGLRASGGQGTEGILVTRVRAEQARGQMDVLVNQMLLNVETAYWNLYSAYYNLYAQQKGLEQGLSGYLYYLARSNVDTPYLLPQAEAQYYNFKGQVLQARADVLNADRNLRGLLGMKSDDGTVFVPTDEPTRTPQRKDFDLLWQEAVRTRPELLILRQDVKVQQLSLLAQKNLRMPDVRAFASYDINALGDTLIGSQFDGNGQLNNALAGLAANQFNSWQIGLRADIPIGFRDANALVRKQQLDLRRAWVQLNDAERKSYEFLVDAYRQLEFAQERITVARTNKLALQEQVRLFEGRVRGGINTPGEFINLTQAQRDLAQRTADEFRAVADYNTALARVEFAKGTIQQYAGVTIAEGALPPHVQKKAADHFRARAAALKLREHPASSYGLLQSVDMSKPIPPFPSAGVPGGLPSQPIPGGTVIPGPALPIAPPPMPLPAPPAGDGKPLTAATGQPTVNSWDQWKPQPSDSGASLPGALPTTLGTMRSPTEEVPGNPIFRPIRDVTLPTRLPQVPLPSPK
jgi:outer membrane protein TolC